eukprot:1141722-Pelagomonas_calceolata.AAC.2
MCTPSAYTSFISSSSRSSSSRVKFSGPQKFRFHVGLSWPIHGGLSDQPLLTTSIRLPNP